MGGSSLQRAELRAILRKIGTEVDTSIEPHHVAMIDGVGIERFVSEFGSLAQACLEAGCSYTVSEPDPEVYTAGRGDTQRREKLISDIDRIVNTMGYNPTKQKLRTFGRDYNQDTIKSFGSWEAAVLEAGVDPDVISGFRTPEAVAGEIERIAHLLGRPPSREFAISQSKFPLVECRSRFPDWDIALESAGLDPSRVDRKAEIRWSIEKLATELDHRPNEAEITHYCGFNRNTIDSHFESIDAALQQADVPATRDLTPQQSLNQSPDLGSDIPTHTQLLQEVFGLKRRSSRDLDDPEELKAAFEKRGVIDEAHFDAQFGSLQAAFDHAETIDPRQYSEPKDERVQEAPKELLAEYARDLGEILERRPIVDEVIALTDTTLDAYLDAFESWDAVFSTEFAIVDQTAYEAVRPSTQQLIDDLEAVGATVERPPIVEEYRDIGQYPVEMLLRRFGSWPAALRAVGVDVTATIPQEYLAETLTMNTIQQASELAANAFGAKPVLIDDLNRIALDIGRCPTWEDVDTYGRFQPNRYKDAVDEIGGVVSSADIPTQTKPLDGKTDRAELITDLQTIDQYFEGYLWPRDIALFGRFTIPTYLATFGTITEALRAADIEFQHLPRAVSSWNDAWSETFPKARSFVGELQAVAETDGRPPTMSDMNAAGNYAQQVYDYYDTWTEALEIAGLDPDERVRSDRRSKEDLIQLIESLADNLGRRPTTADIKDEPGVGVAAFYKHWPTWNAAIQAAGVGDSVIEHEDADQTDSERGTETRGEQSGLLADIIDDIETSIDNNTETT